MINELAGIGYGIITLAVIIAVGMVLVLTFGNNSVAQTNSNLSNQSLYALAGYLGNGTGGLVTWVPLIITFVIGMWFLGSMMVKKGRVA